MATGYCTLKKNTANRHSTACVMSVSASLIMFTVFIIMLTLQGIRRAVKHYGWCRTFGFILGDNSKTCFHMNTLTKPQPIPKTCFTKDSVGGNGHENTTLLRRFLLMVGGIAKFQREIRHGLS